MAGSSELSDALNPNFYQARTSVSSENSPVVHHTAAVHAPTLALANGAYLQQWSSSQASPLAGRQKHPITSYHPDYHDGGLQNASASRPYAPQKQIIVRRPLSEVAKLMKDLITSIHSHKLILAEEKQRRVSWEQQREASYLARQSELQTRISEMEQELIELKTTLQNGSSTTSTTCLHAGDSSSLNGGQSSQNEFVQGSSSSPSLGKHPRSSSAERETSGPSKPKHKGLQPQSLQSAMRSHILRCMKLDTGKELPPPHLEGAPILPEEPVRFVWGTTIKKSPHNAKMKERIVSNMLTKRDLYPLVPEEEFKRPLLEAAFMQSFKTLRENYELQLGKKPASTRDNKAKRARRASRKKIKLNSRVAARKQLSKYMATMFDDAFQLECMSSEESDEGGNLGGEESDEETSTAEKELCVRYLAWRSTRLSRLFQITDEEYNRTKLKRGSARKGRRLGEPKAGDPLPPRGVSRWMVSKKWLREIKNRDPSVAERVCATMKTSEGSDEPPLDYADELGAGSEDEERYLGPQQQHAEIAVSTAVPPEYVYRMPLAANIFGQQDQPGAYGQHEMSYPMSYAVTMQRFPVASQTANSVTNYEQQYYLPEQVVDPGFGLSPHTDMSYTSPMYSHDIAQYPYGVQQQ